MSAIKMGMDELPDFTSMTLEEKAKVMNERGIRVYENATLVVDELSGQVLSIRAPDEYVHAEVKLEADRLDIVANQEKTTIN